MKIRMKSGKINMIYDDKKKLISGFLTQSTNIPVRESFVESCHTFAIKDNIEIEKIEITAKKELDTFCIQIQRKVLVLSILLL